MNATATRPSSRLRTTFGTALLASLLLVTPLAAQAPLGCGAADVHITSAGGTLEGTLVCPKGAGPWPVALLVAGAGPLDRDGNSDLQTERSNTFALLADGLAQRGIATLRYDKRGVGGSRDAAGAGQAPRFILHAQDAAAWVQALQSDARFSSVTVIGHGEGALVGMLAARAADADGFVSLCGHGRPGAEIMSDQLGPRLPVELRSSFRKVLQSLSEGRTEAEVPYELASLLKPSAQEYLVSWFRYDPPTELGRLTIPVLIMQGLSDTQATMRDAQLLNAGQPRADAIVLDGVDHLLRTAAPPGTRASASTTRLARRPVADEVLEGVAAFVSQVRRR